MDWKSTGSIFAFIMFLRSFPGLLPREIYDPVLRFVKSLVRSLNPTVAMVIDEYDSSGCLNNIYNLAQAYLSSRSQSCAMTLNVCRSKNSKNITYAMVANERIEDTFEGSRMTWTFYSAERANRPGNEKRSYQLTFHESHRHLVHTRYIPHLLQEAAVLEFRHRERKLYTNKHSDSLSLWGYVTFDHPSTFDTLALEPNLKEDIKRDLLRFVGRKDYYARVGRAWKRGYLLFGPPGTGKTSLIAAIANFLDFDIYDLELTSVTSNSLLKKLLISTSSKSVIVVEDVDCTLELSNNRGSRTSSSKLGARRNRSGMTDDASSISLSGVLNFVDGLWSSCGGERLMVFTTNNKESLDEALLRPGRMDKHIYMGYCEFEAFKTLARNYLSINEHELMKEVEKTLLSAFMTPADVAEILMGCEDDPNQAMRNVVDQIKKRRIEMEKGADEAEVGGNKVRKSLGTASKPANTRDWVSRRWIIDMPGSGYTFLLSR